ncbi:hypothetical protein [Vibrio owensii]|uniref:hypothetical protein n=1 Tax=Vibrio harveyi group TaxID=717610 RepID=UPI003CC63FA7
MVFNALKKPAAPANRFQLNDILIKQIDNMELSHYLVTKLINETSIECLLFDKSGNLTDSRVQFSDADLDSLYLDSLATKLFKPNHGKELCL